jgi:mycothiol synthase
VSVSELTFRRPSSEDLGAAAAIMAAEERSLRGESRQGADEMSDWWRLFNLEDGSWIVETAAGEPVAFSGLIEGQDHYPAWVCVHPSATGRGLGSELLRRSEARVRKLGGEQLNAGMLAENDAARRLLTQLGFQEIRRFYQMEVALDSASEPPEPPAGFTIEPFRSEDARAFHAALNEAFEDDWGFHSMSFEDWKSFRLEAPSTDLSLWFVARAGDEIAGVLRGDGRKFGGGWVGALGVRKPWRRRGLAAALLQHAFTEYRRRGESHVGLGVDAQNETGATRLYERVGMRVRAEDVIFRKALT